MRKAVLGVMLAAGLLVVPAGPASAGRPSFQIKPQSGGPGTTIHASDSFGECDGNNAHVTVGLQPESGAVVASTTIVPNSDGTWTADVTVPNGTGPGSFLVTAHCDQDAGADSFDYVPQTFTVTGATTTTRTTAPPTTTTTTVPVTTTTTAPVTATAAPPVAVTATPTMTG